jgi:hypothetical protein
VIVVAAICAATAGSIAPASGNLRAQEPAPPPPSGADVSATFTPKAPPGPCITIGGPPTVDFGMLALGGGFGAGSAPTTVTSCGAPAQVHDVMASVSSATAAGLPRWTPFDCSANVAASCVTPTDRFAYLLAGVSLTSSPRMIGPAGGSFDHQLRLPAPGSTGGGEVVRMTVTILGVLR